MLGLVKGQGWVLGWQSGTGTGTAGQAGAFILYLLRGKNSNWGVGVGGMVQAPRLLLERPAKASAQPVQGSASPVTKSQPKVWPEPPTTLLPSSDSCPGKGLPKPSLKGS